MPLNQPVDPVGIRPSQVQNSLPTMEAMSPDVAPIINAPVPPNDSVLTEEEDERRSRRIGPSDIADRLVDQFGNIGSLPAEVLFGPDGLMRGQFEDAIGKVRGWAGHITDPVVDLAKRAPTIASTFPSGMPPLAGRLNVIPNNEPPMAAAARALASRGRGAPGSPPDDTLVHMSGAEVQALANASPIGGLPINPDTGLPEAWAFLLPMILGAGGSALGAAGMAGSLTALGAGAIGVGAGETIKNLLNDQSLGDSLFRGLIAGAGSYGLGALMQGFGAGGDPVSAALQQNNPAQAAAVDAAGSNLMASAGSATPMAGATPMSAPPVHAPPENLATSWGGGAMDSYTPVNRFPLGGQPSNIVPTNPQPLPYSTGGANYDPTGGFSQLNQPATVAPPSLGNALKSQMSLSNLTSAESMGRLGGSMLPDVVLGPVVPQSGLPVSPRKKYNYKRNDPELGDTLVTPMSQERLETYGRDDKGQHRFFRDRSVDFNTGGLVEAGIGSLDPKGEQEIIVNAKLAAMGRHPDPDSALMIFAQRFGVDALRKLIRGVTLQPGEGEALNGPGGGMADLIPAVIDNNQPARLSAGEVVVPADVVSGVGDGDTEAGANRLKDMMAQIRMAKTGSPRQPMPINEAMAKA